MCHQPLYWHVDSRQYSCYFLLWRWGCCFAERESVQYGDDWAVTRPDVMSDPYGFHYWMPKRNALRKGGRCCGSRWSHSSLNIGSSPNGGPLKTSTSSSSAECEQFLVWTLWIDRRIRRSSDIAVGVIMDSFKSSQLNEEIDVPNLKGYIGRTGPATRPKRLILPVIRLLWESNSTGVNQNWGKHSVEEGIWLVTAPSAVSDYDIRTGWEARHCIWKNI